MRHTRRIGRILWVASFAGHRVVRRAAARCSLRARDRWAGAADAAAGAGALAAADLLASVCSSSTATAGLFDVKVLKNNQNLLLQCAGQSLYILWVPSTERVGCTHRRAWVWVLRWCFVGAFIWSVIVQEQRTRLWSAWDSVVCA